MLHIRRRSLLLGASGLAAGTLARPFIGNAAGAEPIKIGMIRAKTGQIVDQAEYLAQGGYIALEQRNNMLLGRPVETVWLDEPNPQGRSRTPNASWASRRWPASSAARCRPSRWRSRRWR